MSKSIEQIWNGNLDPVELLWKDNSELRRIESALFRELERLEKTLDGKQIHIYEKCVDRINDYTGETAKQSFCSGFSLGTRVTAESVLESERLFRSK